MVWLSDVNGIVDQTTRIVERGGEMDVGEVEAAIDDGRLLEALETEFPADMDLETQRKHGTVGGINETLSERGADGVASSYGVDENGLLLVLALCAEVIREGSDWQWGPSR